MLTSVKNSLKEIGYLSKIENPATMKEMTAKASSWLEAEMA